MGHLYAPSAVTGGPVAPTVRLRTVPMGTVPVWDGVQGAALGRNSIGIRGCHRTADSSLDTKGPTYWFPVIVNFLLL